MSWSRIKHYRRRGGQSFITLILVGYCILFYHICRYIYYVHSCSTASSGTFQHALSSCISHATVYACYFNTYYIIIDLQRIRAGIMTCAACGILREPDAIIGNLVNELLRETVHRIYNNNILYCLKYLIIYYDLQ